MVNTRQKGRELEKRVAKKIRETGACNHCDAYDSGQGLDKRELRTDLKVGGKNINIECKNHKKISIHSWWEQVVKASGLEDCEPMLAFHLHGKNTDLICLDLETFCEILGNGTDQVVIDDYTKGLIEKDSRRKEQLKKEGKLRRESYLRAKKRKKEREQNGESSSIEF